MLLYLLCAIMHVDDDLADAGIAQMVKHMVEQGNAAHFDQGLRPVGGQGHHARPLARRHDHRCIHMLNHRCLISQGYYCARPQGYACRTSV